MKYAFYDFAVSPVSYNIIDFIMGARAFAGLEPVHVVLVPGPWHGFRDDAKNIDQHEKRWRVMRLIIPAIKAAGMTFTVCPNRDFAEQFSPDFPRGYSLKIPVSDHVIFRMKDLSPVKFNASEAAKVHAKQWLEQRDCLKPLITVTLREATYAKVRNSKVELWRELPTFFPGHDFVFIPDTATLSRQSGPRDCALASLDLDLRLALYDKAVMNIGTCAGPMTICWASADRPYLGFIEIFSTRDPGGFVPTKKKMEELGFPPGSQWPWHSPKQKIVWEKEELPTVVRELKAIL